MLRSSFLSVVRALPLFALVSVILGSSPRCAADELRAGQSLSAHGSGRATAYPPTNKVVTIGSRTHVTWLDSDADGFWVRIRTLERETQTWSPVFTIGQAQDNHGGAAITVDSQGYLHAFYYPHHDAMRYRRSLRPNDASAWTEEERFGELLTYPVAVCAPDGTLIVTARRSFDSWQGFTPPQKSRPWETELWRRRPGAQWEKGPSLLKARFPGYAQFAESFWWSDDHQTLHLTCRIYETDYHGTGELFNTVGYLVSRDFGETWERRDGTQVALPATSLDLDVIARGGSRAGNVLTTGGVITNGRGEPQVVYSEIGAKVSRTFVAGPDAGGGWKTRDLSRELPDAWSGWDLIVPGAITRTVEGRWVIAATLQRVPPDVSWWGHASAEVGQLWSDDDGHTFQFEAFGPVDPARPRWLPNVERATGHHGVPRRPGITYTDGEAGRGNDAVLSNRVVWIEGGAP